MLEIQKTCSKCRIIRPLTDFNFRNTAKGIRHSYCKECGKKFTQSHYKRTNDQYLRRNTASFKRRRQLVIEAKQKPCFDCGIEYPYYVMDFDHREGESKKFSLYKISGATINKILTEIAKCDVVCANCHRERTQ